MRHAIDRSRRDGLFTVEDEGWTELGAFVRLYRETMVRNDAAPYYFFSESDLARLHLGLAGNVHLLETRREDHIVAAGILFEFNGVVQTFLSASSRDVRPSPKPLFYDDARKWARARGNHVLHLGGGRGSSDDSLLQFKGRFSPYRHTFHVGRWIIDGAEYRSLTEARAAASAGSGRAQPGFFPAYRAVDADPDGSEMPSERSAPHPLV